MAYLVYYNFGVNRFMSNDNVYNYGTNIHERLEFLMIIGESLLQAKNVKTFYRNKTKRCRVDFYATVDQVHSFNFELDRYRDFTYESWFELNDEMKFKR